MARRGENESPHTILRRAILQVVMADITFLTCVGNCLKCSIFYFLLKGLDDMLAYFEKLRTW